MTSKRWPHARHSYSYKGIGDYRLLLLDQIAGVGGAEHQLTVQPERRRALRQQRIVKRPKGERFPALLLPILPQLEQHQFSHAVDQVRRIEGPAFGLSACAGFLEIRLLPEQ